MLLILLHLMNRYLASGDSQVSMSYEFGVGTSTVSQIISETCVKHCGQN